MEMHASPNTQFDRFDLVMNEPFIKLSLALALLVLVGFVSGQKGGAKGAMRGNRGKVRPISFGR